MFSGIYQLLRGAFRHTATIIVAVAVVLAVDVLATKAVLAAEGHAVVSNSTSVLLVLGILLVSMAVMRTLIQQHLRAVRIARRVEKQRD